MHAIKRSAPSCLFIVAAALLCSSPTHLRSAVFNIANGDVAGLANTIAVANSNGEADVINLAAGGNYVLTAVHNFVGGPNGLPVILNDAASPDLTINGNGATIQRNSSAEFRILQLRDGSELVINSLTISGGRVIQDTGNQGGGGIYNNASHLKLIGCTLNNNSVVGANGLRGIDSRPNGGAGSPAFGGAVSSTGPLLVVSNCSFFANSTTGGNGGNGYIAGGSGGNGGAARGGAIYCTNSAVDVAGTTFSSNNCTGGNGGSGGSGANDGGAGSALGGGIYNNGHTFSLHSSTLAGNGSFALANVRAVFSPGNVILSVTSCTFADNQGAIYNAVGFGGNRTNAVVSLANSVLKHGASGSNIFSGGGTVTSLGYNLSSDAAGGDSGTGPGGVLNAAGDIRNTDPQLGVLQNNGGPTATFALLPGSPAIDKGKSFGLTTDQRGSPRTMDDLAISNADGGDAADIGAVEMDVPQTGPTLFVTTLDDRSDGVCGVNDCTLREAILAANSAAGNSTIRFAPGVTGIIQLQSALPNLTNNIRLLGPGANLLTVRRNASSSFRIFTVFGGATNGPAVIIAGLTIRNGVENGGAGIYNNSGTLTIDACHITENHATDSGGGIFNALGRLAVIDSTINRNSAPANSGGGIYNIYGVANITNSTIVNNLAFNGGGIMNQFDGATLNVFNCTFYGNGGNGDSIANSALVVFGQSATVTVGGNIFVTGNSGTNFMHRGSAFTSLGYNLSNDSAGGDGATSPGGLLNGPGDIRNTNPLINSLANYGGPTPTHALFISSPGVDKGKSFGSTHDQRGHLRVADSSTIANSAGGDGADIGAFEFHPLSGPDSDGDGMADAFETFYGLTNQFDATLDSDGDGHSNVREYAAGTNPRDSASNLRITAIGATPTNVNITFSAVAGKTYVLQHRDALVPLSVTNGATLTAPSTGSARLIDPAFNPNRHRFYRVRLTP